MLPLLCQALNDVDVLPWKVLMNEENPHEFRDAAAIPPCPGILPAAAGADTCSLMLAVRLMPTCRGRRSGLELQLLIIQLIVTGKLSS